MWFSEDEYPDEEERTLNNGRWAQNYFQYLPGSSVDRLTWFWLSQATWYDQPKYMDMAYAYENGYLLIESSWTAWDDFIWNDEDASVQTDLQEGNIIHLGWVFHDRDAWDTEGQPSRWFSKSAASSKIGLGVGLAGVHGVGR